METTIDVLAFLNSFDYRVLAVAAAIFGAIANILARTILRDVRTRDMLGPNFLLLTGTLAIFSPWFFHIDYAEKILGIVPITVLLILLIALVDLVANYFYFKAIEQAEVSIATPILSLSPGFVFILSWFVLDDRVNIIQILLAGGIILGIVLMSTELRQLRIKTIHRDAVFPALMASLLFAISAIPTKYLLSNDLINAPTLYEIRGGIIGLIAVMYFGPGIKEMRNIHFRRLFVRGLFVLGQWICLYSALSVLTNQTGTAYTLANTTPVFVLFLSVVVLKEKLSVKKLLAALLVAGLAVTINLWNT